MFEEPLNNSTSHKMNFFGKTLARIFKNYIGKIYKIGYINGVNFKLQKEIKTKKRLAKSFFYI